MNRTTEEVDRSSIDVAGPEDAQPIVFVHGAMFTRKMWIPQIDALSEEYRVIAFDLPGHGTHANETFRMEPALDLLDEVVESAAGGHAILVGLSLGGYVSTAYASRHPEKVDGLVLAGSSANPVGSMELVTRVVGGASRLATRSDLIERGIQRAGKRWVQQRDLPEETKEEIIDSGIYPSQFGEAGPDLAGTDFRNALASYPGPTLVINGKRDRVMRRGEDDHAATGQNTYTAVIDGVGHISNLHRPEAFSDAIRQFDHNAVAGRSDTV
ncbi:alpha/beta fold hydrolase [Halalkalicoccus subterraneus]|uniref:alpha/beta fold hydrolase n=1 Tax=Halalkalicoccus subterraneus TaxID=2675002 RepID=UPI000EFC42C7|nr:alpha/beta hydrolase [Halalkalicoccus subterraneus]